jgi:hypothetical protein
MASLSASASEPRHTRGGAGGAARGQWVKYPLRVVVDADAYAPVDTNVYGKWRALSKGRRATASMEKTAAFLGLSKSTMERSSRRLGRPAPTDGVQELFTKRQTHKVTGTGQTAERWCRELEAGEPYVYGPVRAADALRGILHRLYLGLRHSVAVRGHQPTLGELAGLLRHHGGKNAGEALHEATVGRLLDELEGLGWITQDKRAGYRGRHLITVHDDPVQHAPAPPATPDPDDGSGPDSGDGSLAYKEDLGLNDSGSSAGPVVLSAVRRDHLEYGREPVDNSGRTAAATFRPARPRTYTGPPLTVSARVWAVLAPVHDLMARTSTYTARRIARLVGEELRAGALDEDLHDQIRERRARTHETEITDPGRWLLGVALSTAPAWRSPCGLTDCVSGFMRHTGAPCKACADTPPGRKPHRGRGHPPPAPPPAPRLRTCPHCETPYWPHLHPPDCRTCHTPLPDTA